MTAVRTTPTLTPTLMLAQPAPVSAKDLTIGLTRIRVYCAPNAPDFASAARIFFFVHGGCFWDGDETYNEAQSRALAQRARGIVIQIDFDQRNGTKKAVSDLHAIYDWLLTHAGTRDDDDGRAAFVRKLTLVAVSSGAFFAALLLGAGDETAPPEAVRFCSHVFIAPVFNPFERYRIFTKRRGEAAALVVAKQLDHFLHNVDAMRDYSHEAKKNLCERFYAHPDESIMVFYGADDANVPVTLRAMQMAAGCFTMTAVFSGVGHELAHRAVGDAFEIILSVM